MVAAPLTGHPRAPHSRLQCGPSRRMNRGSAKRVGQPRIDDEVVDLVETAESRQGELPELRVVGVITTSCRTTSSAAPSQQEQLSCRSPRRRSSRPGSLSHATPFHGRDRQGREPRPSGRRSPDQDQVDRRTRCRSCAIGRLLVTTWIGLPVKAGRPPASSSAVQEHRVSIFHQAAVARPIACFSAAAEVTRSSCAGSDRTSPRNTARRGPLDRAGVVERFESRRIVLSETPPTSRARRGSQTPAGDQIEQQSASGLGEHLTLATRIRHTTWQ